MLADEDNSGGIDFDEFVLLYSKVKKGTVRGLSRSSVLLHESPIKASETLREERLLVVISDFFDEFDISDDPQATLEKWRGKEDALLSRMDLQRRAAAGEVLP